jgi:ABC-type uncharacterized transport system permease subunit
MWIRNKAVRITLELGLWILFCSIPVLFMPKHFGHRPESQDVVSYVFSLFILKNMGKLLSISMLKNAQNA